MEEFLRQLNLHQLDGYCYKRTLSGGEMAAVALYERKDGQSPETVVVKFLIAPRWPRELEAFRREAETLLMMRRNDAAHTIVKALTTVRSSEIYPVHYFLMEYVEGETLLAKFEANPLPWDYRTGLDFLKRIVMALLPAAGFAEIHRDLHAGNIMAVAPTAMSPKSLVLDQDPGIRILDFGISRNWLSAPRNSWQEDRFRHCGAVSAWSPEFLADPANVDSKHDVWAIGNLFYRMITGEHAFAADSFKAYYDMVCTGHYAEDPLSKFPPEIGRLVAGMFKKSPRERLSLAGVHKIAADILDHNLGNWLDDHPVLQELYFMVEGDIWKCPLCQAVGNPTADKRCRSCRRYVEEFLLPF